MSSACPSCWSRPASRSTGRFDHEIACLRQLPRAGQDPRNGLLGRDPARGSRPARRPRRDDALGLLRFHGTPLSGRSRCARTVRWSHRAKAQRLIMAGGGTSWLDLALYLIARLAGIETAMQTARINLIDWHDIGQQPFARLARTRQVEDAVIARCQAWICRALRGALARQRDDAAERLARALVQAPLSAGDRHVAARVRAHAAARGSQADARIRTRQPIEAIANEVGYEDAGFFSRLFRRKVSLTPAQYRRRFGAMRDAITYVKENR